jgi:hypothetical protein
MFFEWFFGLPTQSYTVDSDMLYPNDAKTIKYTGPNPTKILFKWQSIVKNVYRIKGADTYEDVFKWDVANPTLIKFFTKWRIKNKLDGRSTFFSSIAVQGEMDKKTKEGWVSVSYKGKIITKIPFTTPFDKALKHLYFQKFYIRQLRRYARTLQTQLNDFDTAVRSLYGLVEAPVEEEAR